jgi:CelD/BcsL family acetyltransferase involved in cellulose biosynthesis
MAQDANKAIFLSETMRAQMHDIVRTAFLGGWLQLAFLEFGGIKAAGYLSFDYANHIWVYNSGLNADFSQLSPGWVLLGYLIQWAIEHKRNCFDFMRGDEIYKYRFGAVNRFVVCASIRR